MKRRVALLALVALLAGLAGCSNVLGPGEPDQERLDENATYEWDVDADVSLTLEHSSFAGVYNATNRSALEAYSRDELGRERRLRISALRYRYPNGTVVTSSNASALSVDQTRQRTIISLPNESAGQVAFTAPRHGKQFTTPVFLEGSYAVRLPENARVGVPMLSQVTPGDYETSVSDGYMAVTWESVTSNHLRVRWYLQRDLVLFTAIFAIALAVGAGGALYYYRQIRRLRRRRDEVALDVDGDDDPRDRGPPPGMR